MAIKVGDRVLVLDDDLSGIVKTIKGNEVTLETEDGFLLSFAESELVLIHSADAMIENTLNTSNINDIIAEKEAVKRKSSKRIKPKERSQPAMEVDLHIHHLVKSSRGMTNFEMLDLQLQTAKRQLEFAIGKRIQRIVFIHGVGEGVLKQELETLFRRYDNIKYYDANFQKYGFGATEVYIYQSVN
ncbi:DNA mismatch repair protein MutS [Hyunsoonleella flava]|uniref:DNA mismatch repair protein MutS n=1 Tax=Hyunsoonleella flava TaxID=2527939 RepID=A0A4Q9FIF4_9FLAO|nr:Smr/MutS family protein [Hyunsoonleella flava]TBN06801.1 DNA mismatch repair protein MutS [Hyunsoonleella flava]